MVNQESIRRYCIKSNKIKNEITRRVIVIKTKDIRIDRTNFPFHDEKLDDRCNDHDRFDRLLLHRIRNRIVYFQM